MQIEIKQKKMRMRKKNAWGGRVGWFVSSDLATQMAAILHSVVFGFGCGISTVGLSEKGVTVPAFLVI